jgi:CBS domain-containing protein
MTKLVREVMHPGLMTCRYDASLGQVAVMLTQHHIHSLVVTDRDGRLLGVITDFDLLAGEWLSGDPQSLDVMRQMTAGDLMSSPVETIEASETIGKAAKRMAEATIRRLIVSENGKPVGVLSVSDIVAVISQRAPSKREVVGDVMSDAFLVCRDKTSITAVARAMTDAGWRSVVVVDENGKPLGVVSGLDLIPYCLDDECLDPPVTQVMHPALTISINASLREAADTMIAQHHHRLVVVDKKDPDSMPLGVISSFDIVSEMARPGSIWQK